MVTKVVCVNIHSSIICNRSKLDTTHVSSSSETNCGISMQQSPRQQKKEAMLAIFPGSYQWVHRRCSVNVWWWKKKKRLDYGYRHQHAWVSEMLCPVKAVRHKGIHTTWIRLYEVLEQAKAVCTDRKQISGYLGLGVRLTKEFFRIVEMFYILMWNDHMVYIIVKTPFTILSEWLYFK